MAVTIDATVGSASANAFVTLVEADAYAETRLNAGMWEDAASDDDKNRAIVEATREISALTWREGLKVTDAQALSWPRQLAADPDAVSTFYFTTTVIPQRVKDATCELALQFIKSGTTDLAALDESRNIKREAIDVLETEYVDPYARASGLRRFPRVWALLAPLLKASGVNTALVRG